MGKTAIITQKCSHCGKIKPVNMFDHDFYGGIKYVVNPRNNKITALFSEYKAEDVPNITYLRENCKECDTLFREHPEKYLQKCSECGELKPLTGFIKGNVGLGIFFNYHIYSNVCISCEKAHREHPEKYRQECRSCGESKPLAEFYRSGRGFRDVCKMCEKAYRVTHKEQIRIRDQTYRATARGKAVSKKSTQKRRTYPSRDNEVKLIIQAMEAGLYHHCPHCKVILDNRRQVGFISPNAATLGHIHPLSRGGYNYASNIIIECWKCNRAQGTKTYAELYPYTTKLEYQEKLASLMH